MAAKRDRRRGALRPPCQARRVLLYFSRSWNEDRGDENASWGVSTWWFEANADGYVARQVEDYSDGPTLRYGPGYVVDKYGQLADVALDLVEFEPFTVDADAFETAWQRAQYGRDLT